MNRLTEKINDYFFSKDKIECDHDNVINKLGKLEDLEEEMDFDLLTLFNIEKVYWRVKWVDDIGYSNVKCAYKIYLDVVNRCLLVYNEYDDFGHKLYFKDYGKTWALTKGELENDK